MYFLPHTVRVIKSRTVKWIGPCDTYGEKRNIYWAFVGKLERKRSLGNDGSIVLKWILKK